ncbi:hypothetical protein [Micromonospora sp. Llam0]|uniref:hypothetical protein n=1 Tax=Micromonospora sp. Llam0 TaxID=2485143 RepID=UPI00131567F7|nr:hypothetical protein [Micromonospora sp. Llam0]
MYLLHGPFLSVSRTEGVRPVIRDRITDLHVHQAKPAQLAAWIRGHWSIENKAGNHW